MVDAIQRYPPLYELHNYPWITRLQCLFYHTGTRHYLSLKKHNGCSCDTDFSNGRITKNLCIMRMCVLSISRNVLNELNIKLLQKMWNGQWGGHWCLILPGPVFLSLSHNVLSYPLSQDCSEITSSIGFPSLSKTGYRFSNSSSSYA